MSALATITTLAVDVPRPSGDPTGMPGLALWNQSLNWVMWGTLAICVGCFTWGGGLFAYASRRGSAGGVNVGRALMAGSLIGAVAAVAAPDAIQWAISLKVF